MNKLVTAIVGLVGASTIYHFYKAGQREAAREAQAQAVPVPSAEAPAPKPKPRARKPKGPSGVDHARAAEASAMGIVEDQRSLWEQAGDWLGSGDE